MKNEEEDQQHGKGFRRGDSDSMAGSMMNAKAMLICLAGFLLTPLSVRKVHSMSCLPKAVSESELGKLKPKTQLLLKMRPDSVVSNEGKMCTVERDDRGFSTVRCDTIHYDHFSLRSNDSSSFYLVGTGGSEPMEFRVSKDVASLYSLNCAGLWVPILLLGLVVAIPVALGSRDAF